MQGARSVGTLIPWEESFGGPRILQNSCPHEQLAPALVTPSCVATGDDKADTRRAAREGGALCWLSPVWLSTVLCTISFTHPHAREAPMVARVSACSRWASPGHDSVISLGMATGRTAKPTGPEAEHGAGGRRNPRPRARVSPPGLTFTPFALTIDGQFGPAASSLVSSWSRSRAASAAMRGASAARAAAEVYSAVSLHVSAVAAAQLLAFSRGF